MHLFAYLFVLHGVQHVRGLARCRAIAVVMLPVSIIAAASTTTTSSNNQRIIGSNRNTGGFLGNCLVQKRLIHKVSR